MHPPGACQNFDRQLNHRATWKAGVRGDGKSPRLRFLKGTRVIRKIAMGLWKRIFIAAVAAAAVIFSLSSIYCASIQSTVEKPKKITVVAQV